MSVSSLLLPVFVQVGLTFYLHVHDGVHRSRALRTRRGEALRHRAARAALAAASATQFANCFHNQFELPVLFYAVVAFILITSTNSFVFVLLAWIFVAARLVHAYIHTGANVVRAARLRHGGERGRAVSDVADLRGAHPRQRGSEPMRPGARMAAAAEILEDILERHRPAATALADWGKAHRFAGSGDRAAIGTLVYDALRRSASIAARMGADTPRALALGAAMRAFALSADEVAAAADGSEHALSPLDEDERAGLERDLPADAPAHVAGDFPDWLAPSFERAFGARRSRGGRGA